MDFQFPKDMTKVQFASNLSQLRQNLKVLLEEQKLTKYCSYTCRSLRNRYLYAKCRYCSSQIRLKKDSANDQIYRLWKANNQHHHTHQKVLGDLVIEAIKDIPQQIQVKTVKFLIKKKFDISDPYFYRLYNKALNKSLDFFDLVDKFKNRERFGYFEPLELSEKQLPSILVASTKNMKQAFLKFGQFCSIDFTYNLIRQRNKQKSEYRIGAFVGLSNMSRIIPFALVIVDNEEKETIAKVIHEFFKLMGKKSKTVISDQQKSIFGALKSLNREGIWDGEHLLDAFHILHNIKHSLKEKKKLTLFTNLMKAENKKQFQVLEENYRNQLGENDKRVLDKFLKKRKKYCFSQIPLNFVGFGVSSSLCEKLNDLIKKKIPYSKPYTIVARKVLDLFDLKSIHTNDPVFQNSKIEEFLQFPELKVLRFEIGKKVFLKLVQQISRSLYCMVNGYEKGYIVNDQFGEFKVSKDPRQIQEENEEAQVDSEDIMEQRQKYKFTEIEEKQNDLLKCSCRYHDKTGIPCQHILKILILEKNKFSEYINERWRIRLYQSSERRKNTGRIRKTRRNRIK